MNKNTITTRKGIYGIHNKVNNKWYIGSTVQDRGVQIRWYQHKWSLGKGTHVNKRLQADWKSYGENAFEIKLLFELPGDADYFSNRKSIAFIEWCYVKNYSADDPAHGYNRTEGGLYGKYTKENNSRGKY